jgi:hypothetical protein
MVSTKDSFDVSTSNILEKTWETLPAEEQREFEEQQEQLIKEAKAKFMGNFRVDRNNKVAFDNWRLIWLYSDLMWLPQGKRNKQNSIS